jgi:hypothetical protein
MRGLFISLVVSALCLASLEASVSTWNKLRVTWGLNLFRSYYAQPSTVSEALDSGYVKISDCDQNAAWRGARYVKDGDRALTLLFDVNGYIAGIQTALPDNVSNGYPTSTLQPLFVRDGSFWLATAYFTDPATICTTGRSDSQYSAEKVGTNLFIQKNAIPEQSIPIPRDESAMAGTEWTEGKCFVTMGKHYWYNLRDDQPWDSVYPFFLLFNGGKLNGLGFAFTASLGSKYYEHPPNDLLDKFMVSVPKSLLTAGTLSTMHIYLSEWVGTNWC